MGRVLEDKTYQSSLKEIDNLYSHIPTKEIEVLFKIFPQRKLQAQMASLVNSSKHVKKK